MNFQHVDPIDRYQRGYRDFFDDLVVDASFEWKRVISKFLLDDDATLLLGLSGGRKLYHLYLYLWNYTDY